MEVDDKAKKKIKIAKTKGKDIVQDNIENVVVLAHLVATLHFDPGRGYIKLKEHSTL